MSNHPTVITTCLNAGGNYNEVEILNPKALLDFSQEQSLQSVQRALGIEYNENIGALEVKYSYARSSQDDAYTMNLNYVYRYSGKLVFKNGILDKGIQVLTPAALDIINDTSFRAMCGDSFISEMNAGVSILFRLSLKFNSSVEKDYFDDSFNKVGGLSNIIDRIRLNPNNVSYTLVASGIQVGGDDKQFNQIFLDKNGKIGEDGYPILNCSDNANSKCINIINQIISYATNIKTQLQKPDDYFYSNPVIASWSSIGIYPNIEKPNADVLKAMRELSKQYNLDNSNASFIANYQNMLLSKNALSEEMHQDLSQLANMYHRILKIYNDPSYHASECYNGFVSTKCLAVKDNILNVRLHILNDARLNNLLEYLKNNQYTANLITDNLFDRTSCLFSPITENTSSLYMLNCNGQTFGDTEINKIQIINNGASLNVSDFSYSYTKNNNNTNYDYKFTQPLLLNKNLDYTYEGEADITINDNNKHSEQFFLTKTFIH
jgi:hypothetical protein